MSTENWWRCPRSSGQLETKGESTWPNLSPSRRRPYRRKTRRSCDDAAERVRDHARSADRSNFLDDEGYPKLGQRLPKRKLQASLPGCSEGPDVDKLTLDNAEVTEERGLRKFSKKQRRTERKEELICIDIKKVLERQRSLSESQTASSPKPRIKLNLNLSIRNPLDSSCVVQCRKGKQREVPRPKRISKLKRVIFRERELKKQTNIFKRELFDVEKMESITKDVGEIDFNRLKISGDQKPEINFVRNMSTMNLFDNKYRKPPSENIPDDVPEPSKTDVVSRLQSLLLERDGDFSPEPEPEVFTDNDNDNEFIDSNIVTKTLCLKICDETGETVEEELAESETTRPAESVQNEPEPVSASPASLRHSRKFREYCTNALTPGLNKTTEIFLTELYRLQRRMYERDEVKGRCRRRFYTGFKEVLRHVESRKIKFVIVAPDLEGIQGYQGGLDETLSKLINACKLKEVVFCFALNKRKLGYFTHKKGSVGCVGVTNYGGLEENFKDVLRDLISARNTYVRFVSPGESGNETLDPSCDQDWDGMLLSTRINLLLKTLTVT